MCDRRCSIRVYGCREIGTRQVGEHWLCERHYRMGERVVARMDALDPLLTMLGIFPRAKVNGHPHSHGWRPYYPLDEDSPSQHNALRALEDTRDLGEPA